MPEEIALRIQNYRLLARLNFECADEADKKIGLLPGFEFSAPPPVMTLCAHSIELSLKAYLLSKGISEKTVKNFGHDLLRAWKECKKHGADTDGIDEHVLEVISDLLKNNHLRYGEQAKLGRYPVYGPLSQLVNACLRWCKAPNLADLVA